MPDRTPLTLFDVLLDVLQDAIDPCIHKLVKETWKSPITWPLDDINHQRVSHMEICVSQSGLDIEEAY
jgi:hypothetical protein